MQNTHTHWKDNLNKILEVNHCFVDIIVATQLFKKSAADAKVFGKLYIWDTYNQFLCKISII